MPMEDEIELSSDIFEKKPKNRRRPSVEELVRKDTWQSIFEKSRCCATMLAGRKIETQVLERSQIDRGLEETLRFNVEEIEITLKMTIV